MGQPLDSDYAQAAKHAAFFEKAESPCLTIGSLTMAGLLSYGIAYASGYFRPLARRVAALSTPGLLAGCLGLRARQLNQYAMAPLLEITTRGCKGEISLREIALDLQDRHTISEEKKIKALKQVINQKNAISLVPRQIKTTIASVLAVTVTWDAHILLGERDLTDELELIPPLLQKTLLELFINIGNACRGQQYWGVFVDLGARESPCKLTQLLPLIRQFDQIPDLAGITFCTNATTAEECQVFSTLLLLCPKLASVPTWDLDAQDINAVFPQGVPNCVTALHKDVVFYCPQRQP